MAKLCFLLLALTIAFAYGQEQLFVDLIKRSESILVKARNDLKNLQAKNSYFVTPLQNEIRKLEVFTREVEKLAKENKIPASQLGLLGNRLLMYENDLLTLLLIEEEASKDLTFHALIQMVDKLLARAYADLGKLITDQSANHHLVGAIREEIIALRNSEDEIKRLTAGHAEEKTVAVIEKVLKHEIILDNLLFQAEHENLFKPKTN